ncbi:26 kDa periplasmic immunogenic protein precursor [Pseudoruegeria aquimaris]|uniref:26 kDa periplasmic immunogenic protein n=1 Tax=Pseudoruegeria aquimaris TaxID=393663 RepID=A0A1Y5S773_9RHOB|nr:SIMPL domain-containing protein [Pseudoruegeria aquimaris]SLN33756.1 26 kDa periplasmic immunogenic protein precursor [Pseudoruegeria aquimaris]
MRKLLMTLPFLLPLPALAQEAPRQITVTAEGQVTAAPDMATVTLGVITEGETGAQALAANSERMTRVLAALEADGIAPADMQTSGLSVSPRWRQATAAGQREITGFVASNMVTVRVRELGALGGVLDGVMKQGGNSFRGVQFGLADGSALMDEARRAAVAEARARAALYAEAAGVDLGDLLSLSEAGSYRPQPRMMEAAMARDSVPIAEGELTLSATVTLVYEIKDAE